MIEFISYEEFPDDQYIKEIATVQIDGKYRVTYVAKMMKTGGKFWDVMSTCFTINGEKKYRKAFTYDSNFQKEEVEELLKSKPWEKRSAFNAPISGGINSSYVPPNLQTSQPTYQQPSLFPEEECPF